MGTKDMTEKYLEAYNDVFADIVNVLLFDGRKIIFPEQLTNDTARTIYKADDSLHEEERDISKFWNAGNVKLAVYGIENQSQIHPYMPFRVIGYDGASYRRQILNNAEKEKYPVLTLVLYYGTEHPWNKPDKISDCVTVEKELEPYFVDYKINIFNIAFLPDDTVRKFTSDFRIVADYFTQVRKNKEYIPSREEMNHVDAVLKMMSVMTGDSRFEEAQKIEKSGVNNMCEALDRVEERGRLKGRTEGHTEGRAEIIRYMLAAGRTEEEISSITGILLEDVKLVCNDQRQ